MKHFLQKLALRLALAPLGLALAGLIYQAGYDKASRMAVRSFNGWTCTANRSEWRRPDFPVPFYPMWLEMTVCDQWTRPRNPS